MLWIQDPADGIGWVSVLEEMTEETESLFLRDPQTSEEGAKHKPWQCSMEGAGRGDGGSLQRRTGWAVQERLRVLGVEGAVGVCPEDEGEGHSVKGKPTDSSRGVFTDASITVLGAQPVHGHCRGADEFAPGHEHPGKVLSAAFLKSSSDPSWPQSADGTGSLLLRKSPHMPPEALLTWPGPPFCPHLRPPALSPLTWPHGQVSLPEHLPCLRPLS